MLVQLDIYRLIMLYIHKMKRSSTRTNHLQICLIGRIVESAQLPILDTEPVLPDVQYSLLRVAAGCCRCTQRVRNGATLDAFTTQSDTRPAEARRSSCVSFFWGGVRARSISMIPD